MWSTTSNAPQASSASSKNTLDICIGRNHRTSEQTPVQVLETWFSCSTALPSTTVRTLRNPGVVSTDRKNVYLLRPVRKNGWVQTNCGPGGKESRGETQPNKCGTGTCKFTATISHDCWLGTANSSKFMDPRVEPKWDGAVERAACFHCKWSWLKGGPAFGLDQTYSSPVSAPFPSVVAGGLLVGAVFQCEEDSSSAALMVSKLASKPKATLVGEGGQKSKKKSKKKSTQ